MDLYKQALCHSMNRALEQLMDIQSKTSDIHTINRYSRKVESYREQLNDIERAEALDKKPMLG